MKKNIIFILIDDMGQRDLSCYGSDFYESPNIDRLAADGMLFTDAYASCPVCSPSRASIMSGKYPATVDVTNVIGMKNSGKLKDVPFTRYLPLEEKSIAQTLREQGYATWHIGKWHLGTEEYYPEKHGFDVNIGGCHMGMPKSGYYSPYAIPMLPDGMDGEYLTDRLTEEAVKLIRSRDKDKPFFLNLWHYAVHIPIDMKDEKLIEKYEKKVKDMGLDRVRTFEEGDYYPCDQKKHLKICRRLVQSDVAYAAMIENLDYNIGVLIDALKEEGLYEETIIIFTSDNGGLATSEGSPTCNSPLAEGKGWAYDGGVRVPLIIRAPGLTKPGSVSEVCVTSPDFYPTILELLEIPPMNEQHVDGKSIFPALKGEQFERGPIFWHYPHYGNQGCTPFAAVRNGDWKLIYFFEDCHSELYNLKEDISEEKNLAELQPEIELELKNQLFRWINDVTAKIPQPV